MNCPKCNKDLKTEGIGQACKGEKLYSVDLDPVSNDQLEFNEKSFEGDESVFYCMACGRDLTLTDEEVIDILKGKDKVPERNTEDVEHYEV